MGVLFAYTLVAGVFMAVAFIIYRLFFAGRKLFGVSRVAILSVFVVSLAGYAFFDVAGRNGDDYSVSQSEITIGPVIRIVDGAAISAVNSDDMEHGAKGESGLMATFVKIFVAGMVLMVLLTLSGLGRMGFILRRGRRIKGTRIVLLDDSSVSPFSFMGIIVMSRDAYEDKSSRDMIIAHEKEHICRLHPVDLVISRLACVVFWYNPASWALQRELCRVHEYQADEAVARHSNSRSKYQMLLLRTVVRRQFYPMTDNLNHLSLTKRISMMNKKTLPRFGVARLAALMIAPAAAFALLATQAFASVVECAAATDLSTSPSVENTASVNVVDQPDTRSKAPVEAVKAGTAKKTAGTVASIAADRHATFIGGEAEMWKYLAMNITYPQEAIKNNRQGKVVVGFKVTADGDISDVKIIRGVCDELDRAALNVVSGMPRWQPAVHDGKPVAEQMAVPVYFKLPEPHVSTNAVDDARLLDDVVVVAYNEVAPSNENVTYKGKPDFTIDGKPYDGNIDDINTEDIQSITVRKDLPEHPNGLIQIELKKK